MNRPVVSLLTTTALATAALSLPATTFAQEEPTQVTVTRSMNYICDGGKGFLVEYRSDRKVEATFGSKVLVLSQVEAASGAKYSDGNATLNTKGNEAFVTVGDNRLFTNCVAQVTNSQPANSLAADGPAADGPAADAAPADAVPADAAPSNSQPANSQPADPPSTDPPSTDTPAADAAPADTTAAEPDTPDVTNSVAYRCDGGKGFQATYRTDNTVAATFGSKVIVLPEVRAASGARYSDDQVTLHTKGNEAFVEVGDKRLFNNCVAIEPIEGLW